MCLCKVRHDLMDANIAVRRVRSSPTFLSPSTSQGIFRKELGRTWKREEEEGEMRSQ